MWVTNTQKTQKIVKKAILLVNLGTPDSPKTSDVRKYLVEFLTDKRVIDIPVIQRNLLVRGIIGPFRAPKSAATYKKIWTPEGSPLMVYSQKTAVLLQEALGDNYKVYLAMRYQSPSLPDVLAQMYKDQPESIRVIPMFPQYASATTGSVIDRVMELLKDWPTLPKVEFVNSYHDHPLIIETFTENALKLDITKYEHFLFSFHGVPVRQLAKSDPSGEWCTKVKPNCCAVFTETNRNCYGAQCYNTASKIVEKLNLKPEQYTICFQSRLGKTPWIQPYTSEVIEELAKKGVKRIMAFSPAFVNDCLETTFEIGEEYAEDFEKMGGEHLQLVESLNTNPKWIEALKDLAVR